MTSPATKYCPSCGAANLAYATSCIGCGYALAPSPSHGAHQTTAMPPGMASHANPYGAPADLAREYREPFSVGKALGQTFTSWVKNAPLVLISTFLLYLPIYFATRVSGVVDVEDGTLSQPLWSQFYGIFAQSVLAAIVTYAVAQSINGTQVSLGKAFSQGLSRMLPVLGVSILVALAIMAGILLLIVPGVIVACMLFVAVPASVMETPGVLGALGRSRTLTSGNKGKIFALAIALFLIFVGIIMVVTATLVPAFSEDWARGLSEVDIVAKLNWALGLNLLLEGISSSFFAVAASVVYCQLRQSQEGASTSDMVAVFQ